MSYTYRAGATILLALDAVEGDPAIVSSITATLRSVDQKDGAPVATRALQVTPRAAAAGVPAGYNLACDSSGLAPGMYRADAEIRVGAAIVITEAAKVRILAR